MWALPFLWFFFYIPTGDNRKFKVQSSKCKVRFFLGLHQSRGERGVSRLSHPLVKPIIRSPIVLLKNPFHDLIGFFTVWHLCRRVAKDRCWPKYGYLRPKYGYLIWFDTTFFFSLVDNSSLDFVIFLNNRRTINQNRFDKFSLFLPTRGKRITSFLSKF